jgi:hypothetical protein
MKGKPAASTTAHVDTLSVEDRLKSEWQALRDQDPRIVGRKRVAILVRLADQSRRSTILRCSSPLSVCAARGRTNSQTVKCFSKRMLTKKILAMRPQPACHFLQNPDIHLTTGFRD